MAAAVVSSGPDRGNPLVIMGSRGHISVERGTCKDGQLIDHSEPECGPELVDDP